MVRVTSAVVALAFAAAACGGAIEIKPPVQPPSPDALRQLWVDPGSEPRDLFWGIGGQKYAPKPDAAYAFKERDTSGFSTKYEVKGPGDVEWSAKIGPEAQTEVLMSRILWGLGFHQQPIYYLPSWTLKRDGTKSTESEARFRPKLKAFERLDESWWWQQNPFVGTQELNGLLVVLLMFNSTDLKNDNNSIYKFDEPVEGADRWLVVRDLGAALGETGRMYPRRNCLECFEQHGFITAIHDDRVEFDYVGRHQELISMIRPADVRWAAEHLQKLTDRQWQDAFRAANYSESDAGRYIAKLKEKIDDGLALRARPVDQATR
ncbi:MAG TPA: hypothetical protein VEP46_12255 [Vicinamibacterales bacterium]|nr:hypothetical protein [Vicinamibacterales bacterium]